jgi:uncharacterized protein
MVLVDINKLRDRGKPLLIVEDFTVGEIDVADDISRLRRPVHSELQLSLLGEQVHVEGLLGAELELTCSRCLKSFESSIEKKFELDYRPDPMLGEKGDEFSLTYSDLDIGFYRDQQVDVTALISEQVVLEIPMKPVCQEECKGLCDQCGADLNKGDCDCQPRSVDPRLAVLAELKKKRRIST